jgi:hypothetical protein
MPAHISTPLYGVKALAQNLATSILGVYGLSDQHSRRSVKNQERNIGNKRGFIDYWQKIGYLAQISTQTCPVASVNVQIAPMPIESGDRPAL